ncbi:MAG TPA: hypothetical protein VGO57_05090 [Verrucomicrobiae bacterium]|jgi:hypothetical protein
MNVYTFFRNLFATLVVMLLGSGNLYAQMKVLSVEPGQTDPAIEAVHGPHLALYDPQLVSRHRLFFFIAGTGSKATNSFGMDSVFAKWGYYAISIDYENNIIATASAHSHDPASFDRYRNAIVTGAPVSDAVKVDSANSILNRFQKLLAYLVIHDPKGGWDEFMTNGKPAWDRIIVAGHSQGSGHAAYLGKMFKVDRVLMFSGPQDYLSDLNKPALWQAGESATPASQFYAFLSQNDPFNVQHQIANCQLLMQLAKPEALAVKPGEAIHGNYQILINNVPKKQAHGSTLSGQFTNVWEYMAGANNK